MVQFKLGFGHFAPPLILTAFAMNSEPTRHFKLFLNFRGFSVKMGAISKLINFDFYSGQNYLTSTTHQPDWQILGSIGSAILRLLDSNKQTNTQDKQSM